MAFGRKLLWPLCRSSELGLIKLNFGLMKNKNRMCQLFRSDIFSYKESKYCRMFQLKVILLVKFIKRFLMCLPPLRYYLNSKLLIFDEILKRDWPKRSLTFVKVLGNSEYHEKFGIYIVIRLTLWDKRPFSWFYVTNRFSRT